MRKVFALSVLLFTAFTAFGQSSRAVYAEVGGAGVLMSANFESRFNSHDRLGLGYRIGVGYSIYNSDNSYYDDHTSTYVTIPLGVNYIFGKSKSSHVFEVGAGITILTKKLSVYNYNNDYSTAGNVLGHFSFMYRRQPVDGGFLFRVGLTPIVGTSGDIMPSGAVAFGYAF